MAESKHDKTANRIASKEHADYNRGQGPDIVTPQRAIEVESESTVPDGLRQLQGFRTPVYIAGASPRATELALKVTEGTTVGVMDHTGKVIRRSTRKRK